MLQAYRQRFAQRLLTLGARQSDRGLRWLLQRAHHDRSRHQGSLFPTLHLLDLRLQHSVALLRRLRTAQDGWPAVPSDPAFLCDSGLGGLARWLRAAGYPARWRPDYEDDEVLRLALDTSAILITTDAPLMDRRVIRQGEIHAFWIAPALSVAKQLSLVRREFSLTLRPPRCMACGGPLLEVNPREIWDRIPPRTRLWLNAYFVCRDCQQLFWHGTHWQRIRQRLVNDPSQDNRARVVRCP